MISKEKIKANLDNCLVNTSFLGLPNGRQGKVRDVYDLGDRLILVTTDRQSAFDRILASVPFKGQVLNLTSAFWFEQTSALIKNHVISIPDPNVTVAKKCSVIPIEVIVRGYLTGSTSTSAWTLYSQGERDLSGNILPDGMVKNQPFRKPIITPTTKSDEHDVPTSAKQIIAGGVDEDLWCAIEQKALELFCLGQRIAAENGLILVDTKYEFGLDDKNELTLIDEIHTPDSSRWWIADSYEERFQTGQDPEMIDKEFLRLWFREHCDPYRDKTLPAAPEELVVELSSRYIQLYERITGNEFMVSDVPVEQRIKEDLSEYL